MAASNATGSLRTALGHARRLLDRDPGLAARQAEEILRVVPGQTDAMRILAHAAATLGDDTRALAVLRDLTARDETDPAAWRALAGALRRQGDFAGAGRAHIAAVAASVTDPTLLRAAVALRAGRLWEAEPALRAHLKSHPTDVAAIRMLAEVAAQIGRTEDAEHLLARAVDLCPGLDEVRHGHAIMLHKNQRATEALSQVRHLRAGAPGDVGYRLLHAAVLASLGEHAEAADIYGALLRERPAMHVAWLGLGHVLKTLGRSDECVAAYRAVIRLAPAMGEAWWSLANLKTAALGADDIAVMRDLLVRATRDEDRLHLHFALGRAIEESGTDDAAAFAQYDAGNAIRRRQLRHDPDRVSRAVERARAFFTAERLAERRGSPSDAPIFVVGLPRSGSTLVEQILASHPSIEGTAELPDMPAIAARLGGPEALARLDPAALAALGEDYLARARPQRKTDRPRFIDKLPNNWLHVGLILTILPRARVIDVRRHPLACCWANYKQHFALGQAFAYDLTHLGRYWRDYAALLAHFDTAAPGRVHRVEYENLVENTETEVRRLLAYLGLPFDPACLRPHETARPVRTASAEQVRRPINRDGLESWRRFERWLAPARAALEDA